MSDPAYFLPLWEAIPFLPPTLLALADGNSLLDRIGLMDFEVVETIESTTVNLTLAFRDELNVVPPGLEGFSLILGAEGAASEISAEIDVDPELAIRLVNVTVALRLQQDLLHPVQRDSENRWVIELGPDDTPLLLNILLTGLQFTATAEGDIGFEFPGGTPTINIAPFMIGDTGIVIETEGVALQFSASVSPQMRGLLIARATIYLPEGLTDALPADIQLIDCLISPRGFSGTVLGEWSPSLKADGSGFEGTGAGEIFGIQFALQHVGLEFQENVLAASEIFGSILLPYFDQATNVRVNLATQGGITVTLASAGEDGLTLTKEDLLALSVRSLGVGISPSGVAEVVVSGAFQPLLMASDGLEWPALHVTDLAIDTRGRFRIKEAWLDLKELATLDLFGFHFELNRIGLGYQETDDKLWIHLTGSLHLMEQIPVGLDVEGFRLTWPRTLFEQLSIEGPPTLDEAIAIAGELEVKFDGVYLFYGVPGAVEFEGLIHFIKDAQVVGFSGDMALRVPATGLAIEAGLMVGMNLAEPPYPFLYVYFGVELPAGIPLAQSGLALKGALGLFGLNVSPDKTPEQNWYYDWYKRGPIVGAHPTNKWRNERDGLAIGIGLTITTIDGYVKGVRGLLVLSIPGPILIIEGRALIFSGLTPAEPPLRALAVIDGREKIIQFNIEAEAELVEDMIDAYGMLEAFFDFKDLTNWHLYLGQDEPRDHRIRANVLKFQDAFLFKADAYLMVDVIGAHTPRSRVCRLQAADPRHWTCQDHVGRRSGRPWGSNPAAGAIFRRRRSVSEH
jgi:hypothetical protein